MKDKEIRKRKYSLWLDESDSDSGKDSLLEDSDIDIGSSAESSKKEMLQDKPTSTSFSTKSSVKKNKWKLSKQLKMQTQAKFLKHISGQEIKESILENNPVPSNFLSRQKLDDY